MLAVIGIGIVMGKEIGAGFANGAASWWHGAYGAGAFYKLRWTACILRARSASVHARRPACLPSS